MLRSCCFVAVATVALGNTIFSPGDAPTCHVDSAGRVITQYDSAVHKSWKCTKQTGSACTCTKKHPTHHASGCMEMHINGQRLHVKGTCPGKKQAPPMCVPSGADGHMQPPKYCSNKCGDISRSLKLAFNPSNGKCQYCDMHMQIPCDTANKKCKDISPSQKLAFNPSNGKCQYCDMHMQIPCDTANKKCKDISPSQKLAYNPSNGKCQYCDMHMQIPCDTVNKKCKDISPSQKLAYNPSNGKCQYCGPHSWQIPCHQPSPKGHYRVDVITSCGKAGDINCNTGYNVWADAHFSLGTASVSATAGKVSSEWSPGAAQWSKGATTDKNTASCYWPGQDNGSWTRAHSLSRKDSWHMYEVQGKFNAFHFDLSGTCGYTHNIVKITISKCRSASETSCDTPFASQTIAAGKNFKHKVHEVPL